MSGLDLMALADRCEAATGADRELDAAIAATLRVGVEHWPWAQTYSAWQADDTGRVHLEKGGPSFSAAAYTASLDAALTLVKYEGGCRRELAWTGNGAECTLVVVPSANVSADARTARYTAEADTPALALCAAALRARAQALGDAA